MAVGSILLLATTYTGYWFGFPEYKNPDMIPIAEEFIKDARSYGFDVSLDDVRYMDTVDNFYDVGLAGFGLHPHVFVDSRDVDNRELIYHEMFHSVMQCTGHTPTTDLSIMTSGVSAEYYHTWNYLVDKLFTKDYYTLNCIGGK